MKPILKLVVAFILLLCLADMPYGFYMLVRFVSAFAFAYLSYDYFKSKRDVLRFVFAAVRMEQHAKCAPCHTRSFFGCKTINQRVKP